MEVPAPTLLLGLGNPILGDDGVGLVVTEAARHLLPPGAGIDIATTSTAGLDLVELLAGRERVVVVDAISDCRLPPGTLELLTPGRLEALRHLGCIHEIDLPTALALGRELGLRMPREVAILAIHVADARTLGDELSPELAAVIPEAAARVVALAS